MLLKKMILGLGVLILLISCSSSQKLVESNTVLDELMASKQFEIKIRTAEPMVTQAMAQIANSGMLPPDNNIGRIDVTGDGYFIKIEGDSVSANLPYYGEQQMGGGYDMNSGIVFNSVPKEIEIVHIEAKKSYQIKFNTSDQTESYFVTTQVANNQSTAVSIQSSHRNRIRYSGRVEALEE